MQEEDKENETKSDSLNSFKDVFPFRRGLNLKKLMAHCTCVAVSLSLSLSFGFKFLSKQPPKDYQD